MKDIATNEDEVIFQEIYNSPWNITRPCVGNGIQLFHISPWSELFGESEGLFQRILVKFDELVSDVAKTYLRMKEVNK